MPGTNIFKEQLQCNEKEWNVKNIVFDPRQLFDAYKKLLRPPTHAIFLDSCHPRYPHYLADSLRRVALIRDAGGIYVVVMIEVCESFKRIIMTS